MDLFKPAGIHNAALRCYRIGTNPTVQHLESVAKYESVADIRNVVRYQSRQQGLQSILFVHTEHLPVELTYLLRQEEIFRRFCRVIGFTNQLLETQISVYNPLPLQAGDSQATMVLSAGFPVTAPTDVIDSKCAFSFGHEELRDFLGTFSQYAGKMVILNLRSHFTTELYPDQLARTALAFLRQLARQLLPSPAMH